MTPKIKELAIKAGFSEHEVLSTLPYILSEFAALVAEHCAFKTIMYNDVYAAFGAPKDSVKYIPTLY